MTGCEWFTAMGLAHGLNDIATSAKAPRLTLGERGASEKLGATARIVLM
jgi:hypothetical protein